MIGTIAAWRAYATARGNGAPASASDPLATQALTRASDYIQFYYVSQFLPSCTVTSPNVEEATYEAANYELTTPGFFTSVYTPDQRKVLTGVKGITWTVVDGDRNGEEWENASPTVTKIAAMLSNCMPGKFMIGLKSIGTPNV